MPSAPQVPKGKAKPTIAFDNLSADSNEVDEPEVVHNEVEKKPLSKAPTSDFQIESANSKQRKRPEHLLKDQQASDQMLLQS
jgi:hypothetical protein